jgi:hypothetical protein
MSAATIRNQISPAIAAPAMVELLPRIKWNKVIVLFRNERTQRRMRYLAAPPLI